MEQARRSRHSTGDRAILRGYLLPLGRPSSLMVSTPSLPGAEAVLTEQRRYVVGPRSVVVYIGKMHEQSRQYGTSNRCGRCT